MLSKEQLNTLSALSNSQHNFNDNRIAFETFGHHFNYNIAVTLANTYVIKGKPAMNADSMAGSVRRYKDANGVIICGYIRIIKLTEEECILGTRRRDELDFTDLPEHTFSFTAKDAADRNLLNQRAWKTMRKTMLHKRCLTALLRCFYPDIIGVAYSPDELAEVLITDEKERDAIVYQSVESERVPSNSTAPTPAPTPAPAPKINPYPMVLKSVNMTASEALLSLDDMQSSSIDALALELKEYLFGYVFDANPIEHIKRALNNLRLKPYQITLDKAHQLKESYQIDLYNNPSELSKGLLDYISNNPQIVLETDYLFLEYLNQF